MLYPFYDYVRRRHERLLARELRNMNVSRNRKSFSSPSLFRLISIRLYTHTRRQSFHLCHEEVLRFSEQHSMSSGREHRTKSEVGVGKFAWLLSNFYVINMRVWFRCWKVSPRSHSQSDSSQLYIDFQSTQFLFSQQINNQQIVPAS